VRREGWLWGAFFALALVGGIAGGAQWLASGGSEPAPPPLRLDELEPPVREPRAIPDLPDGFVPALPPVPTLPPGARARVGTRDEAATDDERLGDLAAEMRLLREARGLVEADPAAALGLLDQHRERFPRGALEEEREVYSIEALVALGRTTEAERRYLELRTDHPRSPLLPRLEPLMQ
jgi:hypothetical protein